MDEAARPAFYAARPGVARDWWTLLHPPYTAWHLSYVVIGAVLAPRIEISRLLATLLGFFLAVGVGAHALDELQGRPLGTSIPRAALLGAAVFGIGGALALGVFGVERAGVGLVPFLVLGPILVVAYNAELAGGLVHTDLGFALAWGAFPVLTAYVAQAGDLAVAPVLAAVGAALLSLAQRALSVAARLIRRRAAAVEGAVLLSDGSRLGIDRAFVLAPLERALRDLSFAVAVLAAALAVARLT